MAEKARLIDFEKMHRLDNFTDETCMRLGGDMDLLVDKVKALFCLFVNGYANMDGEQRYMELVKELELVGEDDWLEKKNLFLKQAEMLDKKMETKGKPYYTVKYNPFMGVKSDWKDDSISA
jgi:hypothetical protein